MDSDADLELSDEYAGFQITTLTELGGLSYAELYSRVF